ncbi:sensor histidine kinase [Planotetraspora silvatica]|uniref:sensor histidine kinase n=1 Tax=Planotetraspora silvatica TaxID=234614 RepID=UPI0019518D0C|nr:HAMP domain-containing sensor histidine kinase [Planotetraspora silvatica]
MREQRRFVCDVSHQLRTPIAVLRATLQESLAAPDAIGSREALQRALSCADRFEAILNDLLVLGRFKVCELDPPAPVDLGALSARVASEYPARLPVRIQTCTGAWVRGSRIQLVRVLENLLNNAQRHAQTSVGLTLEALDHQAVLSVTDDGNGIPSQDRERIFARFTRLEEACRRDPSGSGLGLAISREVAEAHKGTLRVENSLRGARFVLRLPLDGPPV